MIFMSRPAALGRAVNRRRRPPSAAGGHGVRPAAEAAAAAQEGRHDAVRRDHLPVRCALPGVSLEDYPTPAHPAVAARWVLASAPLL